MEAQVIEEQELLEYVCSDGSQVIITAAGDTISIADCDISTLGDGTQVLEFLHRSEDTDGNIILHAQASFSGSKTKEIVITNDGNDKTLGEKNRPPSKIPIESASDTDYHKCDQCGVRFVSKKALKLHKTVHVDEAFYACEFCSASRIHWSEFWQHQCSNAESVPIVCPQCHKTVSKKKQLLVHEEVHALQRRFTSKRMDGYFKRKLEEAEDTEIDWGAKPFICGVCGKPFAKLYEVEYHEKLHTGERLPPNKCDKCGLTYLNKHDLNKHVAMGCSSELSRKTDAPFKKKILSSVT